MLLSRKRVNKGMKRMNSLSLSPVVFSYTTARGKPLPTVQVMWNSVALNSYLPQVHSFSCAYEIARSPHRNNMSQANT